MGLLGDSTTRAGMGDSRVVNVRPADATVELKRLIVLVAAVVALSGCTVVGAIVSSPGPISRQTAEDMARLSSGISFASVEVVSSRLATYGAEHPDGMLAAPEVPVWAVVLSGAFPAASCLISLRPSPGATPRTCPSPAPRERVIVNARTGLVIEVIPGG